MSQGIQNILAIVLAALIAISASHAAAQTLSTPPMDSIYALLPSMPDNDQKLSLLYYVSRNHHSMDTIRKYSLATYSLAKRLGNPNNIAAACITLGWYYNTTGKYELAPKYFREAGEIYKAQGKKNLQAIMVSNVGDSYIGLGLFEEGINHKMDAIKMIDTQHDLARAAELYRTIGKACTEFQQYKHAMEFLGKALENDMTAGDTRGMGRDYFYLGQNINLNSHNNEYGSKNLAKEYLLHAFALQQGNENMIFKIKTCALLSLIYNDLIVITSNWDYADSSLYYYKIGKEIIEQNKYHRDDDIYEIIHAEHTLLSGNYVTSLKTLQDKIQDKSLSSIKLMMLNQAFMFYFYYNNDYEGLLKVMNRIELERKKIYITEFAVEISRVDKIKELENHLQKLETGANNRNKIFENVTQTFVNVRVIIIIGLIFAGAITTVLLYLMNRDKKYNRKLKEQTEEIKAANEELGILMEESQQQSELIIKQTQELKRQRNRLASINLRIVINLDIASRFQASLMPSQERIKQIFKDIFILWRPLEEVSGDFYWGTEVGGLKYVAIADCTGHGIPGASLSMLGISFLNSIIARIDRNNINAAEVLTELRYRIAESLTRGSMHNEDIHDGMDIAICIFDTYKSILSYAGAYRPLWIVNQGQLTEYKPDKTPVAVDHDRNMPFTNHEIALNEGDRVYIFSDGITDQFGERENGKLSKLKPKRLRELLCNISELPPDTQKDKVSDMIDQWRGSNEQTDDIIMIGIINA
ncbi:MAG: DUF2225 domain-containing protein [Bacteroidales bacterium]|nr:DUF2225 domain-containing protein [Bacteroidales bacterium]